MDQTTPTPQHHLNLATALQIFAALVPVLQAAAAPFIKNAHTQAVVATEVPLAQGLAQALGSALAGNQTS